MTRIISSLKNLGEQLTIFELVLAFWLTNISLPLITSIFTFTKIDIGNPYIGFLSYLPFIVLLTLFLISQFRNFLDKKKPHRYKNLILIFFVVVISVTEALSLFYFTFDLYSPILHDPYAHSIWAKSIVVNNTIDFFYSPLLHASAASLSFGNIQLIPKLIVLVTQLSVFLTPVLFSALLYNVTRNKKVSIIFLLLLSCLHFPANLYYTAGKNSFVVALSLFPICIYFLINLFRSTSKKNIFALTSSLVLLFLAHYPSFGIFLFFITPYVLFKISSLILKKKLIKLTYIMLPFMLTCLFTVLWFLSKYSLQTENLDSSVMDFSNKRSPLSLSSIKLLAINNWNDYVSLYFSPLHAILLIPFFLKNVLLKTKIQLVWLYTSMMSIRFLIELIQFGSIFSIILETQRVLYPHLLIFLIFTTISVILINSDIKKQSLYLIIFTLGVISLISNYYLNDNLSTNQSRLNLVDDNDIAAYNYINDNLPPNSKFINSAQEGAIKGMIFPVDGGMWLPVFTDNEILIDFMDFTSKDTNTSYLLLQEIKNSKDDEEEFQLLKNNGFGYIYIDSGVFGEGIRVDQLNNISYETIYESGHVQILKLI